MKVALVVPHIFMHKDILPQVIFSPAALAIGLAEGMQSQGASVTLFSPGPIDTTVTNQTADLSLFEAELAGRGYGYTELLKKHPATFIALARQVQSELIARAFTQANEGKFDVVHIYTNEEDIALQFAKLCSKPVVFTHHDPFNFLIRYKSVFPKYKDLNWISMSLAQRAGMPQDTNWIANIYHGLDPKRFEPSYNTRHSYVAYIGRIIESKGVHLAIAAVQAYNKTHTRPLTLKIAGKHYAGNKDTYWEERIKPTLTDPHIEYVGFIDNDKDKQAFLGGADALLSPSIFDEPFGMVLIEALACGTPVIGLKSGAIPEVITDGKTGLIVDKQTEDAATIALLAQKIDELSKINRTVCRQVFETRFTIERMCKEHLTTYAKVAQGSDI